jgi:hydroxymethylpyrimidine pyrophosphatase-like HAD family hydrolase
MRFAVLASDYDETLADHGVIEDATVDAIARLRHSGRAFVLVTGRELDDVLRVFPGAVELDAIVAENGALVHLPRRQETWTLGPPPPAGFVERLRARGVVPLTVGRVIVATREQHDAAVREEIRAGGYALEVILNKDAVMALPRGVDKGSGLGAALDALGLSARQAVGVGDAENDVALLAACACGVAVANAVPMLRERAAIVTRERGAAGVRSLIDALIADDLATLLAQRENRR